MARLLSQANQETIIAALYRPKVSASDLDLLKERKNANLIDVPSLHDLPGFGELKEWALSAVSKIASGRNGRLSWEEVGTGVLLAGPPGSGKTFCAASLARALGLDFLTVTVGGWQARGPLHSLLQAMRDDFAEAGTKNGLLLFLDEADSIGSRIASGSDDHYWRVVVNELLHQINILPDGVLLVLATNYPDMIDPALLRSGRIDNHFFIGFPDLQTRREILIFYVGTSIDPDRIYDLAVDLEGWSSAELAKKAQEAAMRAKQDGRDLTFQDIADVFPQRVPYSQAHLQRVAVHEVGHALVGLGAGYAKCATISIRPSYLRHTEVQKAGNTEMDIIDNPLPTNTDIRNRIAVILGGMAAEEVVFGDRSIGSGGAIGSDVHKATALAESMVASFGLGEIPIYIERSHADGSSRFSSFVEDQTIEILKTEYHRCVAFLKQNKPIIDRVSAHLILNKSAVLAADQEIFADFVFNI